MAGVRSQPDAYGTNNSKTSELKSVRPDFAKTRKARKPLFSSDCVRRAIFHIRREGCRWRSFDHRLPLFAPLGGGWPLSRNSWTFGWKPKGQLRFVDNTFIKIHQAGEGATGGSKNKAIGLTKGGPNSKPAAAVDGRGHVVSLFLFTDQYAETTATEQILPPLASTITSLATKDTTRTNFVTSTRATVVWFAYCLVPIGPATDSGMWRFIANETWSQTSFRYQIFGPRGDRLQETFPRFFTFPRTTSSLDYKPW